MQELQEPRMFRSPMPRAPMPGGAAQMQIFVMTSGLHYGGATLQRLNDAWRAFGGVDGDGLIVTEIQAGLPAEVAGLRQFDVIKQINGEPISSADNFVRILNNMSHVELTVFRKGDKTTRTITIGSK
jgi:S1-C subfamily serine protease